MPLPEGDDSLRWRRALLAANLEARAYDHFEPAWPAHAPEGRTISSCGPDPLDDYLLDEWFPYRDRAEVEREAWEASVEPVLVAWRKVAASEGSWLAMADEWVRRGDRAAAIAALREGLLHHPDSESLNAWLRRNLGLSDPDAATQLPEALHEEEAVDTPWTLAERIRQLARAGSSGADSEVPLAPLLEELIERQEVGDALEARTAAASWLSPSSCEIALRLLPPDEVTVPQAGEKPVWGEQQACVLEQCSERQRAAALRLQLLPFWEKERFAGVLWWPESKLKGLEWEDVKRELASRITAEPEATVWRHFYDLSLRRLGDEAARLSNLRAWLAADPDDARALSALASLLVGADELTEARRLLERLVGRGDSEVLMFRIATIDALSGDWERVRQQAKLLDGGASTPRRRAEVSYLMGRAALETGAVSEGLRHLRDWVELAQTRDAFPISLVALAHAKAGGVEWSAWQALDKRVRAPIDELPRWSSANPQRAAAMTVARALHAAGHEVAALELAVWANTFPWEQPSLDLAADCLMNGESCRVDLSPPIAGWPELDALVLHRWRGEGSRAERPSR